MPTPVVHNEKSEFSETAEIIIGECHLTFSWGGNRRHDWRLYNRDLLESIPYISRRTDVMLVIIRTSDGPSRACSSRTVVGVITVA